MGGGGGGGGEVYPFSITFFLEKNICLTNKLKDA